MRKGNVRQPVNKRGLIERLCKTSEGVENPNAPFDTYRDLFIFAATVGYKHGRSIPISQGERPIAWEYFANRPQCEGLIFLLGIAATKNTTVLAEDNPGELIQLFEAYANGGLDIIEDWISTSGKLDLIDVLATHILSQFSEEIARDDAVPQLTVPNLD